MKKILIGFNCLLAGIVCILAAGNFSGTVSTPKKTVPAVKTRKNVKLPDAKKDTPPAAPAELPDLPQAVDKVINADVFNNVRSPLANVRSSRNESLVLVGVFQSGNVSGAIIKQNARSNQFNPYLMQAMRMSGAQQRGGYMRWSAMGGRPGNTPLKQYVRVGETMSNGYTLAEVSRQRAVLVRGNDKLELELQDPSKNRSSQQSGRPRMNSQQQYQQAQLFLQAEMIRTFRGMNQGGNRNAPPANRGRR